MRDAFPHYPQDQSITVLRFLRDYAHGSCALFNLLLVPLGFPLPFAGHMMCTWLSTAATLSYNPWFCSRLDGPHHLMNSIQLNKARPPLLVT